jgi:hypothetical protein
MLSPPGDPFVTNTEREIIILLSVLLAWGLVHSIVGIYTAPYPTFVQMGKLRNQTLESNTYTYGLHRLHV